MTKMLNEVNARWLNLPTDDPTVEKALSFSNLKDGWHYGRGIGIKINAVYSALYINRILKNFGADVTEVFPHESGGVLISGYAIGETLDILCEPSGMFSLLHENEEKVFCDVESLSIVDVQDYIKRVKWRLKKSSDLSTLSTIASNAKGLKARAFQSHTTEYQSLLPLAQENTAEPSVIISENSIPRQFPETLRFSCASNAN